MEEQLIPAGHTPNGRAGVGPQIVAGPVGLPDHFPATAMHGNQEAVLQVVGGHDHQRAINQRRGSEAVHRTEITQPLLPDDLSVEVQGREPDGVPDHEGHEDQPAVTGGG